MNNKEKLFSYKYLYNDKVCNTVTAKDVALLFDEPRYCNKLELCSIGSYPLDYNFLNNKSKYLIGMSVPPIMTAQIATNIYEQWISKL